MKFILLILVAFLTSVQSFGSEYYVKYGIGITPFPKLTTDIKLAAVGVQTSLTSNILQQFEVGFYSDERSLAFLKSSPFAFYGLGVEASLPFIFVQVVWSLGGILNPDSVLGGQFQFAHDFVVGLKGFTGGFIALDYKHISSAGIHQPNLGRDFLALKTGIKFN